MRLMLSLFIKFSFLFITVGFSSLAFSQDYYIACYYYDTLPDISTKNPELMYPNSLSLGSRQNYYWALNGNSVLSSKIKLTGTIHDGFFIEQNYAYEDIVKYCDFAIERGTMFYPSKKSYKLYEFKASRSDLDGYEFPVQFVKSDVHNSKIKRVVIFGDSLSDTGNLKRWTKIMPYYPFWYGRFSDALIWNDYLSKRTHLPILNFSVGGAKTEGTNDSFIQGVPDYYLTAARNLFTGNTKDYIVSYLNFYLTSDSYVTRNNKISNPNETLFLIWVGANDYIEKLENKNLTLPFFNNPDSFGGMNSVYKRAVDNIIEQISILSEKGGYHFLVLNLPNFGITPMVLTASYEKYGDEIKNREELSKKLTELTTKHNNYLEKSLNLLKDRLGNKINLTYFDVEYNLNSLIENKSIIDGKNFDYGFTQMNSKYLVPGEKDKYIQNYCYNGGYFKAAFTKIGEDTFKYAVNHNLCVDVNGKRNKFPIFWDSPHPTSYSHCWLSYALEKNLNERGLISSNIMDLDSFKQYCLNEVKN